MFYPSAFGNHYSKVMINENIKIPVCRHMSSSSMFVLKLSSSSFITISLGFRHDSWFPQPQNAVQGCQPFCSHICWFGNLMLRCNRSMLHVYMCCYDCNLAIFIKLVSGIEPNLLKLHSFISWSNSYDKTFCMKISNWGITRDRSKQLSGRRSFIRFCWNRKFNFDVGTHMNVNLLE